MKHALLSLFAAIYLTGCMHRYDITLINGLQVTHVTKPKLDKNTGVYTFKNIKGEKESIAAMRVVEIAPHKEPKSKDANKQPPQPLKPPPS